MVAIFAYPHFQWHFFLYFLWHFLSFSTVIDHSPCHYYHQLTIINQLPPCLYQFLIEDVSIFTTHSFFTFSLPCPVLIRYQLLDCYYYCDCLATNFMARHNNIPVNTLTLKSIGLTCSYQSCYTLINFVT